MDSNIKCLKKKTKLPPQRRSCQIKEPDFTCLKRPIIECTLMDPDPSSLAPPGWE